MAVCAGLGEWPVSAWSDEEGMAPCHAGGQPSVSAEALRFCMGADGMEKLIWFEASRVERGSTSMDDAAGAPLAAWPTQKFLRRSVLQGLAVFLLAIYSERLFEWHERYASFTASYEYAEADAFLAALAIAILVVGWRVAIAWSAHHATVLKEAELAKEARTDRLTGLQSRPWGEVLLAQMDPSFLRFCAIIDARRFSEINSCFGYAMGDKVLVEIAQRLRSVVPSAYVLARVNSDVFVVISHVLNDEKEGRDIIDAMSQRLKQPFQGELDIAIGFSIGVTFIDSPEVKDREVMRRADIALHSCDSNPDCDVAYFEDSMLDGIRRRRLVEINLRKAINNENVVPFLQPIVDGKTGDIIGFEVLARWTDAILGVVSPQEFIDIAEQSGLIGKLGEQLLTVACRRAALWPGNLKLSVNLSASDLNSPTTAMRLLAILGATGFPSRRLQIEVTESMQMQRSATSDACIATLRSAGIAFVIDDFGTGYCSFERLAGHQFDGLKIDKSFVQGMETHADMAAIVLASVQIGKQLGLTVTAEGVETAGQWATLMRMGCDMAQG
ncbi:MAG: bifunctional diguanylate cyclase/phosphodiesterase [Phyllobacteriaceae bacterium]|nr:bifunctional diguanylate cyclase/phosphodiesterase [Phyllobacteriaceae bacterium]